MEAIRKLAPAVVPNPPIVTLTARSEADSTASDSTIVCLVQHDSQWNLSSASAGIRAGVTN